MNRQLFVLMAIGGVNMPVKRTEVVISQPGQNEMSEFKTRFNDYVGSSWYNRWWRKHKLNVAAKNLNKALQIAKSYDINIGGDYGK